MFTISWCTGCLTCVRLLYESFGIEGCQPYIYVELTFDTKSLLAQRELLFQSTGWKSHIYAELSFDAKSLLAPTQLLFQSQGGRVTSRPRQTVNHGLRGEGLFHPLNATSHPEIPERVDRMGFPELPEFI